MAMLGKRFQRTISMSQIGPGGNVHSEKAQAHPTSNPSAADPTASHIKPLTLADPQKINDQMLLQAATHQWEALKAKQQEDLHHHHHLHHHHLHVHQQKSPSNPWEALKGFSGSPPPSDYLGASLQKQQELPPPGAHQWDILKNAEAMMMMMMMQSGSHDGSVLPSIKDDDDMVMASSPIAYHDSHLHTGLWPRFPNPASTSPSSCAHFLDACFLCKRRLRHERDIFIYRGDAAFCSEECRHRQILSDETLSLRASKKGGSTYETTTTT